MSSPCSEVDRRFPPDFLCPAHTSCVALSSDYSAALCCPAGVDCKLVHPITCDVHQLNATAYPYSEVHSNIIPASLDQCGTGCCPPGLTCQNNQCRKQALQVQRVQSAKHSTFSTQTRTSPNPGRTGLPASTANGGSNGGANGGANNAAHNTSSSHATNSATNSSHAPPNTSGAMSTTTWALIAVLASIFAGLLAAFGAWCLYRRRRSQSRRTAGGNIGRPSTYNGKAGPNGILRTWPKRPVEMEAMRSPKELFVPRSLQELDHRKSPRELPAIAKRPRTINSIRQELDAAGYERWMIDKETWI